MSHAQRLIHITDLHFCASPGDILCSDVVTDDALHRVLDEIIMREGENLPVLVTGDLVQDPLPIAYQRLCETLSEYPLKFYCLPGNHDDPAMMRQWLTGPRIHTSHRIQQGPWTLLLLDSTVAGEPGGHLSEEKLRQLNLELESLADHPVLIALHHHPLPVGSPWMDRMGLGNQKDFFDILRSSPANVKGVIFGHVHQQIDQIQHGIRCIGSPSTCVQFAPNTLTFTPDSLPPAYRWLDLHDDGSLKTNIHFVEDELSVAFG